jgi:hypothetical protein
MRAARQLESDRDAVTVAQTGQCRVTALVVRDVLGGDVLGDRLR